MDTTIKNEIKQSSGNFANTLKKFGAAGALGLGLILMVSGILLSVFAFFEKTNFDKIELFLLISSFILFGLGSHCLDLLEKEKKAKGGSL